MHFTHAGLLVLVTRLLLVQANPMPNPADTQIHDSPTETDTKDPVNTAYPTYGNYGNYGTYGNYGEYNIEPSSTRTISTAISTKTTTTQAAPPGYGDYGAYGNYDGYGSYGERVENEAVAGRQASA